MTKEQVINFFGTRLKVAEVLGLHNSAITRWQKVPHWHQLTVEKLTDGKLKADKVKKPKPKIITTQVCFKIPTATLKRFKKSCKKNKQSMSATVSELIKNEICIDNIE